MLQVVIRCLDEEKTIEGCLQYLLPDKMINPRTFNPTIFFSSQRIIYNLNVLFFRWINFANMFCDIFYLLKVFATNHTLSLHQMIMPLIQLNSMRQRCCSQVKFHVPGAFVGM